MNALAAITLQELTRRFGDTIAVDHLSLEIQEGEVFGFLGHNGAGKTTTVRMLNGVLRPDEGSARVLGLSPVADGPALRRRTGVLTETPSLYERLTARENLRVYADLYDVPAGEVRDRANELLTLFELEERADELVGGYSKGMKQRLALARALLHAPELLFLDEPTAGLDPVSAHRVQTLIAQLSHDGGHTVLLCTHNLDEAQRLCDRVAVLENGRLAALGAPSELAHRLGWGLQLEIELATEDVSAALEIVRAISGVEEAQWSDGVILLRISNRVVVPDLVAALVTAGERVYRVSPRVPALEDVYLTLHGEAERL